MKPRYHDIAAAFDLGGQILAVKPHGNGLINDTYRITLLGDPPRSVILQRINDRVFPNPVRIMENLRTVLDHVHRHQATGDKARSLQFPGIFISHERKDYVSDSGSGFWRAIDFIDNTCSFETIAHPRQAEEVGFALGRFHALLHDLEPDRLHDTLPGFHVTPRYLARFKSISGRTTVSTPAFDWCLAFIRHRESLAGVLEAAKREKRLRLRPIHGDPKLNNFLFDADNGLVVSLIDLDTVKPGLVQYDIGDCLRSCCNVIGENSRHGTTATFDLDICHGILNGYFHETREFFNEHDYAYLYPAIRLIPFELGLRYLTDYLEGNNYFKTSRPDQNLQRAMTQFQLVASIEQQQSQLEQLIADLARPSR